MPTFIKTGFWDKLSIAPKNYLDLDLLISSLVPSITGYVPYTGATSALNLGTFGITAASIVKSGGTSSQFLKADGSVDGSGYVDLTTSQTIAGDKTFTGVFKETITLNTQTASYSLVLADRGKLIQMNVASANTLTVPLESSINFPIGSKIDVTQYGAGQTTITATVGVTIRSFSAFLKLAGQYAGCTLVKIGTNEWHCYGNLIA